MDVWDPLDGPDDVVLDLVELGVMTEPVPSHVYCEKGSKHHNAKLDEEAVAVIRQRLREGDRVTDVAADYRISKPVVSAIRDRRTWRHIP